MVRGGDAPLDGQVPQCCSCDASVQWLQCCNAANGITDDNGFILFQLHNLCLNSSVAHDVFLGERAKGSKPREEPSDTGLRLLDQMEV